MAKHKHHPLSTDDDLDTWKDGPQTWDDDPDYDPDFAEVQAGHVHHRLTDWMCGLFFIVATAIFISIYCYGVNNGDIERLYHGYNFLGHMCGFDTEVTRPLLFFCQRDGVLDIEHPICVEACPQNSATNQTCFSKVSTISNSEMQTVTPQIQEVLSEQNKMTFASHADYPTKTALGAYCIPLDPSLEAQARETVGFTSATLPAFSEVARCWRLLLVPAATGVLMALVSGWFLVNDYARSLLSLLMLGCFINLIALAIVFWSKSSWTCNPLANRQCQVDWGEYEIWGVIVCLSIALWVLCSVVSRRTQEDFEAAIGCMHAVMELHSNRCSILLVVPVLDALLTAISMMFLWTGLLHLVSTSHPQKFELDEYALIAGSEHYSWSPTWNRGYESSLMFWYYVSMCIWFAVFNNLFLLFVVGYIVTIWYFTSWSGNLRHAYKKMPSQFLMCRASWIALRFHLGSIALGGFVLPWVFVPRLILKTLDRISYIQNSRRITNYCSSCLECYASWLAPFGKAALIEMAVNSTPFFESGRDAFCKLHEQNKIVRRLVGSMEIFRNFGCGMGFTSGYLSVMLVLDRTSMFHDPSSPHYVSFPVFFCFMSGMISMLFMYAYMGVCDMITDTLLFCRVSEEDRVRNGFLDTRGEYAPRSLTDLIELYTHEGM